MAPISPFISDQPWLPQPLVPAGYPAKPVMTATPAVPDMPRATIAPMSAVTASPAPALIPPGNPNVLRNQTRLDSLYDSGTGVSHIHNPLLHGIAAVGDALYSRILPGIASVTPGTTANHLAQVHEQEVRLANDRAGALQDANLLHTEAATRLANDQADVAEQKSGPETEVLDTDQGKVLHVKGAATTTPLTSASGEPLTAPDKAQKWAVHDSTAGPILVNDTTGEAKAVTLNGAPVRAKDKVTQSQPIIGPDGKPHTYLLNESGEKVGDLGVHYERPVSVNVSAGTAALDRETKQFGGAHQKSVDAANAQLEKIDSAISDVNGSAISQAVGIPKVFTALVSGQGTGVRITQAEINSIAQARGLGGNLEGTLNSLAGKGKLTATQQRQLTQVLQDARARVLQKQAIASHALDAINGASTREQIIEADRQARQQLGDLEKGNPAQSGGVKIKRDGNGRIVGVE